MRYSDRFFKPEENKTEKERLNRLHNAAYGKNDAEAYYELGMCYKEGIGIERNDALAISMLLRAQEFFTDEQTKQLVQIKIDEVSKAPAVDMVKKK